MPRLNRFSGALRPCTAFLLYVCAWATFPPAYADQQRVRRPARASRPWPAAPSRVAVRRRPRRWRNSGRQPTALAAGVLGQLAAARGRYDEAIAILEPAVAREPGSEAALQLGLIELQLGRTQQATRHLTEVLQQGASGRDVEALFRGARAAQALGRPRDANSLFKRGGRGFGGPRHRRGLGPAVPREIQQAGSAAFAAGRAEARPGVGARARRPRRACSPTRIRRRPPPRRARRSRSTRSSPTRTCCSPSSISTTRSTTTRALKIQTVLEINPSHLEARSWLAASAYVRDDQAGFDAEVKRVLAINPAYGDVYRVAADLAARNYRFEEAVALTRRAVALDPGEHARLRRSRHAPDAHRRRGARRARRLERSFNADPFDQVTYNLLSLLDTLDKFVVENERRSDLQVPSRRGAGDARVRDPAGARRAEDAVGEVPDHAEGADPDRGVPEPRRLRRAHARPARDDRRARRLLRPGRDDGLAEGAASRARSRGRRRCGTSWRTSSRCSCRISACRAG